MLLKTKSGRVVELPDADEELAINAGIAADTDNPELDAAWFAQAKPASQLYPPEEFAAMVAMKRPRGRPKAETTKVFTAIRLDADLVDAFKATGKGWHTRVNAALRESLSKLPLTH